jgi:hypothetical protein
MNTGKFILCREFIEVKGDYYEILRIIRENLNPNISAWENHLCADIVFRKEGYLFFCRKVKDAEIIEENERSDNSSKINDNS